MQQIGCLSEAELSAYQLGELPPDRVGPAEAHLTSCPRCTTAMARLDGVADGVVAALRRGRPSPAPVLGGEAGDTAPLRGVAAARITLPGSLVGYEVLEEIGRGGMGVVHKARQVRLNRVVALKMILAGAHAQPAEFSRFLIEAETVVRLDHPNIVRVYEVGANQGLPFIALEYVPGGSLAERLRAGPWPAPAAAALVEQLARAVDYAHGQGVIHRDLKPANILLGADGVPKIADFGLAKLVETGADLTATGTILGTPAYMAPEQAEGNGRRVGPSSDVHALGVILYELLAGRTPFQGDSPMDVLRNVATAEPPRLSRVGRRLPRDLCTICHRCLQKDPHQRYASAGALADDLGRFLVGEPILARRVGDVERVWKWMRRRPAMAALMLAVTLSLIGWAVTSTYLAVAAWKAEATARGKELEAQEAAQEAQDAAGKAQQAESAAVKARQDAESWAGRLAFNAGVAEAQAGRLDRGLHLMLQALRSAPSDPEFQRVVRSNVAAYAERLPVLREMLEGRVSRAWFLDPDGKTFVTLTPKNTLQRWDVQTGQKVGESTPPALPGDIREVSSDGKTALCIVMVEKKMRIFLVDVSSGKQIGAPLLNRYDAFTPSGFDPGGDVAWVTQQVTRNGKVCDETGLYEARTGQPIRRKFVYDFRLFRDRDGRTIWMSFPHPNGGEAQAKANFKELPSQRSLPGCDPDPASGDATVRFDGNSLVTLGRDGLIRWWSPVTGRQTRPPWQAPRAPLGNHGALLPNGRTLVIWRSDGRLAWFDLPSGQEHPLSLPIPGHQVMAISPEGTTLLINSHDQPLKLWRIENFPSPPVAAERVPKFLTVTYSPDRRMVYTGTDWGGGQPYGVLTETATGRPVSCTTSLATNKPIFSGDGKLLATLGLPYKEVPTLLHVCDVATGRTVGERTLRAYLHSLAFVLGNRMLAVGHVAGTSLLDLPTLSRKGYPQSGPVSELLFSPDGKWLACGSRSGWTGSASCFRVLETATGRSLGKTVCTSDAPRFAWSPDGKVLHTLELSGGRLRRWEVVPDPRQLEPTLWLHRGSDATHAVFRADSRRLLTGYRDGRVRQWVVETGKTVGEAMSHPAPVTALAYSPDGKLLAVGCEDGAAWLRDAATGLPLGPPTAQRGPILGVAFSRDGNTLLSTSADGRTLRLPVPTSLTQSIDVLETWLQTATGMRFEGEEANLLDARRWREGRQRLANEWPEAVAELRRPARLERWHEARAQEAEIDGVGYRWELDRLIELQGAATPANWLSRARRAHLHVREDRLAEAEKDYQEIAAVAGEPLQAWYRRCAAEARFAGKAARARWYQDRLDDHASTE